MTELKDEIFKKLQSIDNEQFLNSILDLVQNVDEEGIYQLTDLQISDIEESIAQIERGEFLTHEEVMRRNIK